MAWHRHSVDQAGWMRFEAWLYTPAPGAPRSVEQATAEGEAFLSFMAAAASTPDAGGGDAA